MAGSVAVRSCRRPGSTTPGSDQMTSGRLSPDRTTNPCCRGGGTATSSGSYRQSTVTPWSVSGSTARWSTSTRRPNWSASSCRRGRRLSTRRRSSTLCVRLVRSERAPECSGDRQALTGSWARPKTPGMTRYGQQFGPDFSFLGVPMCDLDDPASYDGADVVILGGPFDGGTSHRPGARFGPRAIRMQDYLPHDGSRPSLALRTDGLQDLRVVDAGDVEMYSGDIETALPALEAAVEAVARAGAIPVVLGGDHSIAFADARGVANVLGHGRVSMVHFDAHADTGDIEFGSLWGHGQPMRRLIESGA